MSTQAKQLKDVPVIDIGAGTPVLALDSSGAVGKGSLAAIATAVASLLGIPSGATIMKKVIIPSVTTDFNALNDDMTVYSFVADVPQGATLTNSPKSFTTGGFMVQCIKEGTYRRQIATFYGDSSIYVRTELWSKPAKAKIWGEWSKISADNSGGVIYCPISLKGGGRHEHSGYNADQQLAEVHDGGRDGVSGTDSGHGAGYALSAGRLPNGRSSIGVPKYAVEGKCRMPGGVRARVLYLSTDNVLSGCAGVDSLHNYQAQCMVSMDGIHWNGSDITSRKEVAA